MMENLICEEQQVRLRDDERLCFAPDFGYFITKNNVRVTGFDPDHWIVVGKYLQEGPKVVR